MNCSAYFEISDDLEFKIITNCTSYPDSVFYRKSNDDRLLTGNLNTRRISVRNKKDGILIRYRASNAGNPLVGFSKEYLLLSKSNDGSLIIKDGNWAYGIVFFIIPIGVNRYIWYRIRNNSAEIIK